MPYSYNVNYGNLTCYQHIGQHSEASYKYYSENTISAKENEYKELLEELENIGYNCKISKRINYSKLTKTWK